MALISEQQSHQLQTAVSHLKAGAVIAYPTETVWGFGCDPNNQAAVLQLLKLKQRPIEKGLILVAADSEQFVPYLSHLDFVLQEKFNTSTDVPTTWLVPGTVAPAWVRGDFDSVALRVSTSKLVKALCQGFGGPIVSTSANVAGQPTASSEQQLQPFLEQGLSYILPGSTGIGGRPSVIRDLLTDRIIRS